jgi:PPOX class probable FMN-dependent enzyme
MAPFQQVITSPDELANWFRPVAKLAVDKEIDHLDEHCKAFIAHAPFVVLATTNADGTSDASPKGGPAGFVRVLDDHRLAFGELPGNNRLDGYRNLIANPAIGLLFLIPGIGETLRVNGSGYLVADDDVLDACTLDGRRPKLALGVEVREAFIHCAKAIRRSHLWDTEDWPDVSAMPTPACMIVAHTGLQGDPDGKKTEAALEHNYQHALWNEPAKA